MTSMLFFEESQQHLLQDIRASLVELRQLIDAQAKSIRPPRFEQQGLTEEPPDGLDARCPQLSTWHTRPPDVCRKLHALSSGSKNSPVWPPDPQLIAEPTRRWSLPQSVTQAPLGIKPESLPWSRLEPPRFDGEDVRDWIRKIQEYYNYHYTPLDDRLYLIKYLFDHPASTWLAYWEETNKGKSWDDFLLAVKQRFDPDLYEDQRQLNHTTENPVVHRQASTIDNDMMSVPNAVSHKESTPVTDCTYALAKLADSTSSILPHNGVLSNDIVPNEGVALSAVSDLQPAAIELNGIPLCDGIPHAALKITNAIIAADDTEDNKYDMQQSTQPMVL